MTNLSSPAIQHDFENLLLTKPDIYDVIEWLKVNVDPNQLIDTNDVSDIEYLYTEKQIEKFGKRWAEDNGYHSSMNDFNEFQQRDYREENKLVKAENLSEDANNIEQVILSNKDRFNLSRVDGEWVIYDTKNEEILLSGEEMWELEVEAEKYLIEQERIKREQEKLAKKAATLAEKSTGKKRGRKPGSKNGSKNVSEEDKAEKSLREFAKKQGLKIVKSSKEWKSEKYHIMSSDGRTSMFAKTIDEAYKLIEHKEDYKW